MSKTELEKLLNSDTDGMETYEYIVDHTDSCLGDMECLVENLKRVDINGQFVASTARYLNAIDRNTFEAWINKLVEVTIEKDRERRYLGALLEALWGKDYQERAYNLMETDNNFRRIYKRLFGKMAIELGY